MTPAGTAREMSRNAGKSPKYFQTPLNGDGGHSSPLWLAVRFATGDAR